MDTEQHPEKFKERKERNGYVNGTKWSSLGSQVKYSILPTPAKRDYKGENSMKHLTRSDINGVVKTNHTGQLPNAIKKDTNGEYRLQPKLCEWMMGFPDGWTDIQVDNINNNDNPDWEKHWTEIVKSTCMKYDNVNDRSERLKALGNSIVPQIVLEIFKAIEEVENI